MKEEKQVGYRDIFHQVEYMKMMIAALINRFGDSIDAIASVWIVYEITGNAAWSAIMFGVNRIPSIVVTPLAGAWVEGRKKKTIMVVTDLIRAACVAFVATGYMLGFLQAWMLVITTLIISTVEAFRGPANSALLPKVLDKKYYEYGMSLSSTLGSIVELIGTAIAATIIALIGTSGAIYIDMATFIMSAVIIMFVNTKEQKLVKKKFDSKEYFDDLADGFSYVKKDDMLKIFMVLSVFLNAIMATFGMLFGSITYPMVQKFMSDRAIWMVGGLGVATFYILLPVCRPLYTSKILVYTVTAVLTFIMGYTVALVNSHLNVFMVKRIRQDFLARTDGITIALSTASMPIASFLLSVIVAYANTSAIFIASGVLALLVTICMLFSKTLAGNGEKSVSDNVDELQGTEAV